MRQTKSSKKQTQNTQHKKRKPSIARIKLVRPDTDSNPGRAVVGMTRCLTWDINLFRAPQSFYRFLFCQDTDGWPVVYDRSVPTVFAARDELIHFFSLFFFPLSFFVEYCRHRGEEMTLQKGIKVIDVGLKFPILLCR